MHWSNLHQGTASRQQQQPQKASSNKSAAAPESPSALPYNDPRLGSVSVLQFVPNMSTRHPRT